MNKRLISLVVPMYKVEPYIAQCLESILCQTADNFEFEVIAVDDGSPDKSGEIADKYASADNRLKVLKYKNSGLSEARNRGLAHASGEYVWFIDSDDWIAENALTKIATTIRNNNYPEAIHICGADVIGDKTVKLFSLKSCEEGNHTGMQMLRSGNFHGVVQYTIYRRDFLMQNGLRFYPGIYHEDTEFSPKAYYYLRNIVCIDEVLYLKRVNDDSITRKANPKKNRDLVKVSKSMASFARTLSDPADRNFFMRRAANVLKMALTNEVDLMDKKTRREFNSYLKKNKDVVDAFIECDLRLYRYEGKILKMMSGNMLFAYYDIMLNPLVRILTRRKEKFNKETMRERWLAKRN